MANPFFCKLGQVINLPAEQKNQLDELLGKPLDYPPHSILMQQGRTSKETNLVIDGIAYLQRGLPDGSRVITSLLLPGDFCCTNMEVSRRVNHAVITLTRCSVIKISQNTLDRIEKELPHVVPGLWRLALAEQGIAREWFVNVAGRSASKRMAHLFCEVLARFQIIGLAKDGVYPLPLTQRDLADILGISAVHVNRTLRELRAANLVSFDGRYLKLRDAGKLKAFCHFSSDYLLLSAG